MATEHAYRAVIKCRPNDDNVEEYFEMDVTEPVRSNLSADITYQPMVNGDMLADHMIIRPTTLTLTGSFSLAGSKHSKYEGGQGRLANIQNTFEKIMKSGIKCTIQQLARSNDQYDSSIRFVERQNMALQSIAWTENNDQLDAVFGFEEVQSVDVSQDLYEVDVSDSTLPALTEPATLDFTDKYLDWNKIDEMVVKMCYDCGIVDDKFLEVFVTISNATSVASTASIITGIASLVALGVITSAVIHGAIAASAVIFPVGTVIAVTAVVALGLAALFSWMSRESKKQVYKVETFKAYKSDRENQAEVSRFNNFVGSIHNQLLQLKSVMSLYSISSNVAQECMLNLDDNYYIFAFEKNNTTGKWSLKVTDYAENEVGSLSTLTGLSTIADCCSSNYLFRTSGAGSYVYIMNSKQLELSTNGASQAEIEEACNDLTNYEIFVSKINMNSYNQVLADIIKNALEA